MYKRSRIKIISCTKNTREKATIPRTTPRYTWHLECGHTINRAYRPTAERVNHCSACESMIVTAFKKDNQ